MPDWMIYGATGYTGALVAEEAVKRGHRPLLAGRSENKLRPLAEQLELEYAVVSLENIDALTKVVSSVSAVYHAAGPFAMTSMPMLRACLKAGTHYLDISGEISAYKNAFLYDSSAKERGMVIIPGVGFDVIPSDCLIKYVAGQLPDATHLEVAVNALQLLNSAGTSKSTLEIIAELGIVARRNGWLRPVPMGSGAKRFPFTTGRKWAMPVPWGDLEIGYHTSRIPNITTYLTFSPILIGLFSVFGPLARALLKSQGVRSYAGRLFDLLLTGPSQSRREMARASIYARVWNANGEQREAWLETVEAYQYSAKIAPLVMERVLNGSYRGALTPAQAFGADFALEVEGTRRYDRLS